MRYPKPPGQLDLLTESDLLEDFAPLRRDYGRFAAACYALDVVETLTVEASPDRGLYELLVSTARALADGDGLEPAILGFECRALRVLGFFPRSLQCGSCREPIGEEGFFSCHDGGAICTNCRPRDPGRIRVGRAVLESLSKNGEGAPRELRAILNRYIAFLAERRLRTWISFPRS